MRARTLWLLSLVSTGAVVGAAVLVAPYRSGAPTAAPPAASSPATSPTTRAVAVLEAWDRRRAAAWVRDDRVALRALYVRPSSAGRRDAAMLAAYHRRGLRVTTMQRQVLALRLRTSAPRELSFWVTDRLAVARVSGPRGSIVLPRSRPATHRIVLRRGPTGWQVVEVYDD